MVVIVERRMRRERDESMRTIGEVYRIYCKVANRVRVEVMQELQ